MSRRQRQFNELRDLCSAGAVVRAIDLAFEHFAHFGRDDEIVDLLAQAMEDTDVTGRARQRFGELCASHDSRRQGLLDGDPGTVESCRYDFSANSRFWTTTRRTSWSQEPSCGPSL